MVFVNLRTNSHNLQLVQESVCSAAFFWFLVCVTEAKNHKPACPLLWGLREMHTAEEMACKHTGTTTYTIVSRI